jgi:peptidoglycan L-alanyl-D-glutamate endopeptidase CwlK
MPLKLSLPVEGAKWLYKKIKGGMQKDVEEAAQALLTVFREELGVELVITAGYRSQAEQDKLYDQGRTRPGPVVTWSRTSKHTQGRAFDITVKGLTPNQVPRSVWYAIGEVGEAIGLKWGGRWRGKKDMPHFEM